MTSEARGHDTQSFDHQLQLDAPILYLLVIDSASSRRFPLPTDGIIHIGRSSDADIQLESDAISRLHAKLICSKGVVRIADLGSHNGTLVNGERIEGSCALASGDVVTITDTLLVLRSALPKGSNEPVGIDHMHQRIDQEIARAVDYDRPFSIVVVRFDGESRPVGIEANATAALRPMDVVCLHGMSLIALLPELDARAGLAHAQTLLDAFKPLVTRAGLATYPADGADTATLLAAARRSIDLAAPGQLRLASITAVEHQIGTNRVIVADVAMVKLYELLRRLAKSDIAVLLTGETGSGKEIAAAALHRWSPRADRKLLALNCSALPETLAESELFGHERGAFSDAKMAKVGLLESAKGGTLFLDEVGDLPLTVQAKLLRAIELKKIIRLGDVSERPIDVRVVAATNVNLELAVAERRFRQDLLFRLGAARVEIPPLRQRQQEISMLARLFLDLESQRLGRSELTFSDATLAVLARYAFPGNVRELKNAVEWVVATAEGPQIQPWDLPAHMREARDGNGATEERRFRAIAEELRDIERQRMVEALSAADGVQTRAAALIGMPLRTFTFRLRQYGIDTREYRR